MSTGGVADPTDTAPGGSSDDGPESPLARELTGRSFESTEVTGRDLVPGSHLSMSFDEDVVRANAGCNHLGGAPAWDGDQLSLPEIEQTAMGCEDPLMEQEAWFAKLLTGGVTVTLAGNTLMLTTGETVITLLDSAAAHPDGPLTATTWTLDGIIGGSAPDSAVSSAPQDLAVTLRIHPDQLDVFNGLTWMSAPLAADQDLSASTGTVRITEGLAGDGIGCPDDTTCFVDVSVLGADFTYEITADRLTVTDESGRGLMFREVPSGFTAPDLLGRTYRLARLWTDDGGADTKNDDAEFTITFATTGASAESSCGPIDYPTVRYYSTNMIDLGEPVGPACSLGSYPPGVPSGELIMGVSNSEMYLSTGFTGWYFELVG